MSEKYKYKAKTTLNTIELVAIVRETKQKVMYHDFWGSRVIERWEVKQCNSYAYFDTWKEAQDWLLKQCKDEIDLLTLHLKQAKDKYGNVKGMKNPSGYTKKGESPCTT